MKNPTRLRKSLKNFLDCSIMIVGSTVSKVVKD